MGASVRQRLLTLSRATGQTFDLLLTRYVLERLLYRLSLTPHRERFVLKGAMLMVTWFADPHRPTRDVDFLGFGDPAPDAILAVFRDVCAVVQEDGVAYDLDALRVEPIREAFDYGGLRLRTRAFVAGARVNVVVDIGFGDAVEPGLEEVELPVLLGQPAPRLRAYARETVIAEKFQAMVALGRANTRLKDFYDVWVLSRTFAFDTNRLARAIHATFRRRGTPLPAIRPDAFSADFSADPPRRQQWAAFVEDLATEPLDLAVVVEEIAAFLMLHAERARLLDEADTEDRS
jgi:predicted nucleotidyltransferase component of viral defense system